MSSILKEMITVKIDQLQIHLKGISPQVARTLVSGLGNELMSQLTKQRNLLEGKRAMDVTEIGVGTLQPSRDTSVSDLRRMVASRIAESITSNIKSHMQEE